MYSMVRSVLAVVLGWAAAAVLALCTDLALQRAVPGLYAAGQQPAAGVEVLALASTALWAAAGGWLTARLAPRKPMAHVLALLGCGEIVMLVSVGLTWGRIQAWYQLGLLLLWPAAVAAGGWLQARRQRRAGRGTAVIA